MSGTTDKPLTSQPDTGPANWRFWVDAVLYSSVWLALAAVGLTWASFLFWRVHIPPRLAALIFSATLFLYNLDSVLPYKYRQGVILSGRKQWMFRHRPALIALTVVALVAAGGLFLHDGWLHLTGFLGHLGLISVLYSVPVVRLRGRWRALRDFPLLKVFLIAYVWSAVTVQVPALYLGIPLQTPALLLLFARRFFFILALAFVFDIRDYSKDRLTGTRTFPGVFGVQNTKWVALVSLLIACVLLPPGLSLEQTGILLLPSLLAAAVIWFATENRSDYYFALLADGVMIVQFLAVYWTL